MEKVVTADGEEELGRKKPPEGGPPSQRMSFKEKLMGSTEKQPVKERVDLFDTGKMTVEYVDDNPMLPRIRVDRSVIETMCAPWKEALVVCLLGKRLGYRTMKAKLDSTWKPTAGFELMDVDNEFYLVTFDKEEDKNKVIGGGPWTIFDHYLEVSTWSPEFISPAARVQRTLAWIRIPGLNVAFYDESFLMYVARAIGRPIKVDTNTLSGDRGRFARICVELDLTKAVIGRICTEDLWYKVEYEGLHIICTKCGCYGHRSPECKGAPPETLKKQEPAGATSEGKDREGTLGPGSQAAAPSSGSVSEPMTAEAVQNPNQNKFTQMHTGGSQTSPGITHVASITVDVRENEQNQKQNPTIEVAEVEILGEWMTVSKKKKKPLKSWDKDRGGNHGKFNSNDEHQKPKGIKAQNPKRSNDASGPQRPTRETGSNVGSRGKATITQRSKGDKSAKVGPFAVFSLANQEASSSTDWLNLSSKKRRTRFEDWDKPSV
ncbi:uncharacterized protein LOC130724970 [Lotus japonicus]|uniref:uncharacterized protein LOC130724970 n=1 Tax=Lotus japonicus TaxID=34305 RepID=UPI00258FB700|nr:uncharacterized protein LOC130724970 [Lotus japonicus]